MTGFFTGFAEKRKNDWAKTPETEIERFDNLDNGGKESGKDAGTLIDLPVDMIDPNPGQPRRYFDGEALMTLADSIRKFGILQPLSVTYEKESGRYVLVAGERRLRAARLLGFERVPSVIIDADPERSEELAIIENIQREDLNIFEEARAIASLLTKYGMTQEQAAAGLSVSQSYVANKLRLLKLSREEAEAILESGLSERHARALLRLKDQDKRMAALRHIIARRMNVAATEEYVERLLTPDKDEMKSRQNVRIGIRDIKLFCNSIDRAVDMIKRAGVPVSTSRKDSPEHTEIVISIPTMAEK